MPKTAAKSRKTPKGAPIVIPNAEVLTEEELAKQKHNEKIRRYRARESGQDPGERKKTKQEIRKLDTQELIELTQDLRNVTGQVLMKKLMNLMEDEEQLSKINIASLTTSYGIFVDKAQLLQGLATQHVAVKGKIDVNMSSDEALKELAKMREKFADEK